MQAQSVTLNTPPAISDVGSGDGLEVLTFDLAGETFALEAILVREVLDKSPETYVPGAPAFVDAVINFRGRIIPLADLRLAFGLETSGGSSDSRIVVIEFEIDGEAALLGLRADKVYEVTTIPDAATEAAPRLGTRWRPDFIRRLAKQNDDIIVLPDLASIFAARGKADGEVIRLPGYSA
jgi:purine-binding chemotaxis protein CheW